MKLGPLLAFLALAVSLPAAAAPADAAPERPPHERLALDIFRELIEIDTVTDTGDTAAAADAMAARLLAAGFPPADVQVFKPAPRKGNVVARLRGSGARRPMMLLAHLDVVEARREDWSVDPFRLTERDGWFYGRGTTDDKFMAAAFVANLIRYRQEGFRPTRDLVVVLETDEETDARFGIRWLLEHQRAAIDAEFALNEGAGIGLKDGRPLRATVQTSEKVYQSYRLEVTHPGGHSALPTRDNAIYRLADGLARMARFEFPLALDDTTRAFFARQAASEQGQVAEDMRAVAARPPDAAAAQRLSATPVYNAQLRTTCVATRLDAGHADNALPQAARATVNCRILPGQPADAVRQTLVRVLDDAQIAVTPLAPAVESPPSPLDERVMRPIERLVAEFWPGIPVIPVMSAGATDARYLRNAGIATYGHSGLALDLIDVRAHGKDERVPVRSFFDGCEYLYRLVKALSSDAP
jgi:acetylornithine deacetylase/succinyl-diaminopimelate desuccinylase-like protein